MKKLFTLLLICVSASCIREKTNDEKQILAFAAVGNVSSAVIKVPYDSTYKTTHDTSTLVNNLQTQSVTHDTTVNVASINTVSVTHDSLVKRRNRRGVKTISTTHDSSYIVNSSQTKSTTHDTSFYVAVVKVSPTTHDTTSTFYKDSVPVTTKWGASGPDITPDILKNICGSQTATRTQIILDKYRGGGDKETDTYLAAGIPIFVNLNLSAVGKDAQGNKVPNPFEKDTNYYKNKLIPVFEQYKNNPKKSLIIFCCENEPTTGSFHSGPMSDYLKLLKIFVRLCNQYGFKCTDGGIHVGTVNGANLDKSTGEGKPDQVAELLTGYATIKGMYAVCMHTSNANGDTYSSASTVKAVQKVLQVTGYKVVSNEWHSQYQTNTTVLLAMAKGWSDAGVEYAVYISGTGDAGKNNELNNGATLTQFGSAYKNFIQTH